MPKILTNVLVASVVNFVSPFCDPSANIESGDIKLILKVAGLTV